MQVDFQKLRLPRMINGHPEGKQVEAKRRQPQEVFILADSPEEARSIQLYNDEETRKQLKAKFNYIAKVGEVAEEDLPETKIKTLMVCLANVNMYFGDSQIKDLVLSGHNLTSLVDEIDVTMKNLDKRKRIIMGAAYTS